MRRGRRPGRAGLRVLALQGVRLGESAHGFKTRTVKRQRQRTWQRPHTRVCVNYTLHIIHCNINVVLHTYVMYMRPIICDVT